MGCGCAKTVRSVPGGTIAPLDTPTQATLRSRIGRAAPVVYLLSCDGEHPVPYTDRAEAIAAARARGCSLEAASGPANLPALL